MLMYACVYTCVSVASKDCLSNTNPECNWYVLHILSISYFCVVSRLCFKNFEDLDEGNQFRELLAAFVRIAFVAAAYLT